MKSEWREYKLGNIANFVNDKIDSFFINHTNYVSTENMVADFGGIEKASNLPKVAKYNKFEKGDVLFSNIRTYFKKVWQSEFIGGASPDVLIFRTKNEKSLDQKYLYYLLTTDEFINYTVRTSKGAKMPRGDKSAMMNYDIILPPLPEQKAISKILSSIDDKIEINRQVNKTLEEMAQALFKSWFIDFEPVKAKIAAKEAGTDPELAAIKAISPNIDLDDSSLKELKEIAALFPDEMEESELGEVPKGWKVGKMGEIVEVKGGSTPSTANPDYWNGEYYWTTPKDLSNIKSSVLLETERKITSEGVKQIGSGILPKGTLLLSSRAPIGYLAIAQMPISINQGYIAIAGKSVSNIFMLYWLKANMTTVKERANGSTFQEINKANFREIGLVLPHKDILKSFDIKAGTLFNEIVSNESENQQLAQIRDSLLPKLMSGELEVGDVCVGDLS